MILIFDVYSGLCNQMMDINCAINFCIINKIKFSFRYCTFRDNNNLHLFYDVPFEKLFNINNILDNFKLENLYENYNNLKHKINKNSTFDNKTRCIYFINKNISIYNQLKNLNKEYIILKQFWPINNLNLDYNTIIDLKPSNKIYEIYKKIIIDFPLKYNSLHYRFESDFKNHFKCDIKPLNSILETLKFKNKSLKTYIATSNIYECINKSEMNKYNIYYKDDNLLLQNLNFEEKAYIDYLICLNSEEFYGNDKSSFSHTINNMKKTNNYY